MSNKDIIFWVILLIIFGVLTFTTPAMDSQISGKIWIFFITLIIAIVLIKLINNTRNSKTTENTENNNTDIIIKVLWALLIISIIFETVFYTSPGIITTIIIFLIITAYICQWFFKKEE